jgi:serine/threonine protein kinase
MVETLMKKQLFAGKFEIQGEIAKGKTGTIYYGYDMGLRQEVAIKVYHSHINGRLIRGNAFIEKSKPLLLIDHPNLIKIFKVEEEDDTPVVFMEFFDAPSLQQMIYEKGPLSVQDMLMLAREITEVLVHTHFQGIIHGTLHPGHVLVGPQGQIKVMDLGLSWILMDILSNCDIELLRPLPYLPPELAKGELLNLSSDLYSLGFMMYEMLTGTVPYAGLPKTSIMGKLAFDQADPVLDFPNTVPEAIGDLIRQMTRNKSQQRLQDATHVLTIINQQLAKLPLNEGSTFSPSVPPQPQETTPKEPEVPKKASIATAPLNPVEPPLKKTPKVQRPDTAVNYGRAKHTTMLHKTGIALVLISLVAVAGTLGYWYRDILEPYLSTVHPLPDNTSQNIRLPQAMPVERENSIASPQEPLNIQEPPLETDKLLTSEPLPLIMEKEPVSHTPSPPTPLSRQSEKKPSHSNSTQPLQAGETERVKSLAPTKKQSDANPAPTPVQKEPSTIIPATSAVGPLPNRNKAKENELDQNPPPLDPTKEIVPMKVESDPTAASAKEMRPMPTDEEIEELLQSLDAPAADPSSIPEPESFSTP